MQGLFAFMPLNPSTLMIFCTRLIQHIKYFEILFIFISRWHLRCWSKYVFTKIITINFHGPTFKYSIHIMCKVLLVATLDVYFYTNKTSLFMELPFYHDYEPLLSTGEDPRFKHIIISKNGIWIVHGAIYQHTMTGDDYNSSIIWSTLDISKCCKTL